MPYSKNVVGNRGFCPQCKITVVFRKSRIGTMPTCEKCKDKNRRGRNQRTAFARKNGLRLGHYNRQGIRYERLKKLYRCFYCHNQVEPDVYLKGMKRAVCHRARCRRTHQRGQAETRARCKTEYHADKVGQKLERLKRKLKCADLTMEWYAAQVKKGCGICKTRHSGYKGWTIDHSHLCCPSGTFCRKCVRGILCGACNLGLGQFQDDAKRLRRAATWVSKRHYSSTGSYVASKMSDLQG